VVIVCGKEALDPARVASICEVDPCGEVCCLPWVTTQEELEANLVTNRGRPNKMLPCEKNFDLLEAEHIEFNANMPGDAFGRMADLLRDGASVVNQVYKCRCRSDFYGNVLTMRPGAGRYVVATELMDRYFPHAPLSAKVYAATTVAVEMTGTDEVEKLTGRRRVPVLVVSEWISGLVPFFGFLRVISGMGLVGVFRPDELILQKEIAVFRYNRGYRIPPSDFARIVC